MIQIQKKTELAPFTTFKIGGEAKFFVQVFSADDLVEAVNWARVHNEEYFILGGGSNLLFSDDGYDGLIIKLSGEKIDILGNRVSVDAGVPLGSLVAKLSSMSLSGLEWAIGIPGTLGGAIRGNAGARGGSMSDCVKEVIFFDGKEMWTFKDNDLDFTYRSSVFKKKTNLIILSAVLELQPGADDSKELMRQFAIKRVNSQPKGFSAGSIFKNPKKNSAGALIEACGLKSSRVGGAIISEKHANFIINTRDASSADVLALIDLCTRRVFEKFNIKLETEIEIV